MLWGTSPSYVKKQHGEQSPQSTALAELPATASTTYQWVMRPSWKQILQLQLSSLSQSQKEQENCPHQVQPNYNIVGK